MQYVYQIQLVLMTQEVNIGAKMFGIISISVVTKYARVRFEFKYEIQSGFYLFLRVNKG